jgi:alpha-glucuronidase
MKTGNTSVFHPHKTHIIARLDVTVLYTIFEVLKNIKFRQKTQGVKLHFLPKKRLFAAKTDKKIVFPIFLVG